jgi:mono/diheme cytochrome c family protein
MVRWIALGFLFFAISLAARADADKKTERLWKSKCASCHGADGKAQTDQGQKMGLADYSAAPWQKAHPDAELKQAIREGVDKVQGGKKQQMDGYKDLTDDQVDGLVAYIRTFGR